ncbi:MAG TPA: histidinol-phosphate transaminase [Paenalcaligenes sp.]|nr:histidinol-phosphate transaminase [Paenalcaligenes sp.]
MSQFWSDHVHALEPYVPGEQPKENILIKLNTNEHAYGPSPRALEAIQIETTGDLRLYPAPGSDILVRAIASTQGVVADQVFVGNSSDEVLAHIFNGLLRRGDQPLWLPDITYSFYKTYCRFYDIEPHYVALNHKFEIDPADYVRAQQEGAGGIIFANPNAPTGHCLSLESIKEILQANPEIPVVVDEAYIDFGGASAASLLEQHPNLIVTRTFSKGYALAGLRVGYALASPEMIMGLQRIKDSFNSYPLDRLAQVGAAAAIADTDYYQKVNQQVIDNREYLHKALEKLNYEVLPSKANFVFARPLDQEAKTVFLELRKQGILVRYFEQPRIDQYLRITVGTREQCEALVKALQKVTI